MNVELNCWKDSININDNKNHNQVEADKCKQIKRKSNINLRFCT